MMTAVGHWSRRNLFAKPFDTVLSLLVVPICAWLLWSFATWVLTTARWDVVQDNVRVLMIGVYPAGETWRAWLSAGILLTLCGAMLGSVLSAWGLIGATAASVPLVAAAAWIAGTTGAAIAVAMAVAWAAAARLHSVRTLLPAFWAAGILGVLGMLAPPGVGLWGGLLLSVLITLVASLLTLPLGILLAFGRRSRIASLRICCTAYIEVMRSVPLILVVYWIWIVLPLLTSGITVADVARGMIGFVLFFSAYVAEYVRSGLQSVPRGQVEAAQSLGMSTMQLNYDIVLPQAVRVVVPALVGNVLDIFNAAPLVFIIGLTDFLRAGQMVLANPAYSGRTYEVYVFLFAVYFLVGSLITFAARRLETHLARGKR